MELEKLELKDSLIRYLSGIREPILTIVSQCRLGKEQEAYDQMILLTEGLSWVSDAVHLTREYHTISVGDIRELLEEVTEAIENTDMILVADLLEYELVPKINEWQNQLLAGNQYVH